MNWLKFGSCNKPNCPYTHDPAKKGSQKRDNRRRSPTPERGREKHRGGSPRRSPSPAKTGTPRDPSRLRGKSPSGKTERPPCHKFLMGECKNGKNGDYWHPPSVVSLRRVSASLARSVFFGMWITKVVLLLLDRKDAHLRQTLVHRLLVQCLVRSLPVGPLLQSLLEAKPRPRLVQRRLQLDSC